MCTDIRRFIHKISSTNEFFSSLPLFGLVMSEFQSFDGNHYQWMSGKLCNVFFKWVSYSAFLSWTPNELFLESKRMFRSKDNDDNFAHMFFVRMVNKEIVWISGSCFISFTEHTNEHTYKSHNQNIQFPLNFAQPINCSFQRCLAWNFANFTSQLKNIKCQSLLFRIVEVFFCSVLTNATMLYHIYTCKCLGN